MEKRIINPWQWQDERHYVQGVEVRQAQSTLYCAGQAAVLPDGTSSSADMQTQLLIAIENLEKVLTEAGYEAKNIVRLTIYTTAHEEFFACFDTFGEWVKRTGIKTAATCVEVKTLYESLKVELEATAVK
jgi:2-iminobutanoate/2-iminopropanoate deaminase